MKVLFTKYFRGKNLPENTPNLHVIIVANTSDPTIGKGCAKDMKFVRDTLLKLSVDMEIPVLYKIIDGSMISKQIVQDAIDSLTPSENDIVFFYYSGHGFSYKEDAVNIFPQLDLRSNPIDNDINVINASTNNAMELYASIKAKGARLNLVISDCCNSLIDFYRAHPIRPIPSPPPLLTNFNKEAASLLFLKTNGSVLASAAKKGQYAIADETLGSVYTNQLFKKLNNIIYKEDIDPGEISWKIILEKTKDGTTYGSSQYASPEEPDTPCIQVPIYKIDLQNS
jgi:hypothetical protein